MTEERPGPDGENIDGERLSRLLDLGGGRRRAGDELLEHLEDGDGPGLWQVLLDSRPEAERAARLAHVAEKGTLAGIRRLYDQSKRGVRDARHKADRLASLATLFLCMAAAAVHHDAWITSRARDEMAGVFLNLSLLTPEPCAGLFARAVEV